MKNRIFGMLAGTAAIALSAVAANAADLPSRRAPAPMVAAVPLFTWTGFYVGAQVGYQFSDREDDYFRDGRFRFTRNGSVFNDFEDGEDDAFVAGAHAGYNFQFGSFVVGVEGDIEGVFGDDDDDDFDGLVITDVATGQAVAYTIGANQLDWQGSIRARAGFAFDRTLVYATGGFAFGGLSGGFSSGVFDDDDDTVSGYTVGLGVEHAFTNNLTARLEYRYTSFDEINTRFGDVELDGDDFDFHTVRLGVSFKF
ncbi:MAG TPA: outer membrane protein [Microvirga sp.]|jgi:outer membrane immunogenic protein|nr:outer membrane protein [Microvirga sp.]